jgi:monovalent cation/proton antiporter MnhG/PhaG subunit
MSAHTIFIIVFLTITASACWIGVLGMLRMREPMQAMHYLTLPASIGIIALTIAVFLETGASSTTFKTLLIAIILLVSNSVVTHATGRAFRTRELGHWEPHDGDPIEFVAKRPKQEHRP